ncbi:MAG: phosphoribosylglycinamide formyltransferase [Bacteroidales bacterium]|nr:phosphoribosylglycinamide formyltransferase [Bacteroidales bacterium]
MHKLAIFASGSGTNAENIIEYFRNHRRIQIACVCSNRPDAPVIQRAKKFELSILTFSYEEFYKTHNILDYLERHDVSWIILAGFLWLVPEYLIHAFENRILNIHPALLPKYGGKGMYGERVHKAVLENHEKQSGITIHIVDREYDRGKIVFQATCPVLPEDSPESLAARVHRLEYEHYPRIIEQAVSGELHTGLHC